MPCTPLGTTTPLLGLCKPAIGELDWGAAINGNWDLLDAVQAPSIPRSYLAGLTLSTAGASTSVTVAAGQAVDGGNTNLMTLAAALTKTTGGWALGTGNGGLDSGVTAISTWYHFYLIKRTDTNVVDVLFSLSASAPTMPTNYTLNRRIGSVRTDASGNWTAFTQDGDTFLWNVPVSDYAVTNPGTAATLRTLTVPTGITVFPVHTVRHHASGINSESQLLVTSPAQADTAPSSSLFTVSLATDAAAIQTGHAHLTRLRTNTSGQLRTRVNGSSGASVLSGVTYGWIDRRGRDA